MQQLLPIKESCIPAVGIAAPSQQWGQEMSIPKTFAMLAWFWVVIAHMGIWTTALSSQGEGLPWFLAGVAPIPEPLF